MFRRKNAWIAACFSGASLWLIATANAQILHAVLVGETITESTKSDVAFAMGSADLKLRTNVPKAQLNLVTLDGNRFRRQTVLSTIRALRVQPADTIFFYYTGHGFYRPGRGSYFTPPADDRVEFRFSEIHAVIKAKQPRFSVSILDCCSVIPEGVNAAPAPALAAGPPQVTPLFDELFFRPTGDMVINSSSPGEYALCRSILVNGDQHATAPGTLFSNALFDALNETDQRRDWAQTLEQVRRDVNQQYTAVCPNGRLVLGPSRVVSQDSQTVWAIRDNAVWFAPSRQQ